jgi:hypothetical protein
MHKAVQLSLTKRQIQLLLETVQGFIGNQKLLHLPDAKGEVTALPLTEAMLTDLLNAIQPDPLLSHNVQVIVESQGETQANVLLAISEHQLSYQVQLDKFDEQ